MGTAGSLLSLAIDHSLLPDTYCCTTERHEELNFVTVFETEPVMYAAVTCLSTKEFSRVWIASSGLRMNEAMMVHMRKSRIATFRTFQQILNDEAVNTRLWFMLHPRDMDKMAVTSVYPDDRPMPPFRDWERREKNTHEFFRHNQRRVMASNRAGHDLEEWSCTVIYNYYHL